MSIVIDFRFNVKWTRTISVTNWKIEGFKTEMLWFISSKFNTNCKNLSFRTYNSLIVISCFITMLLILSHFQIVTIMKRFLDNITLIRYNSFTWGRQLFKNIITKRNNEYDFRLSKIHSHITKLYNFVILFEI